MIQPSELRIGNLIYWADGSIIGLNSGADIDYNNDYKPIPLTLEILEKFGLKLEVYGHNGERDVASVNLSANISISDDMEVWANDEPVAHIKHLHQLQNLYFALTGTELSVNI